MISMVVENQTETLLHDGLESLEVHIRLRHKRPSEIFLPGTTISEVELRTNKRYRDVRGEFWRAWSAALICSS
jgi:hypothetical protein